MYAKRFAASSTCFCFWSSLTPHTAAIGSNRIGSNRIPSQLNAAKMRCAASTR